MNFDVILFAFAKEFGWGYDYVAQMPFKIFRIYARELGNYYMEREAAIKGKGKGKKQQRALTNADKERRKKMISDFGLDDGSNNNMH